MANPSGQAAPPPPEPPRVVAAAPRPAEPAYGTAKTPAPAKQDRGWWNALLRRLGIGGR